MRGGGGLCSSRFFFWVGGLRTDGQAEDYLQPAEIRVSQLWLVSTIKSQIPVWVASPFSLLHNIMVGTRELFLFRSSRYYFLDFNLKSEAPRLSVWRTLDCFYLEIRYLTDATDLDLSRIPGNWSTPPKRKIDETSFLSRNTTTQSWLPHDS